MSSYEHFQWSVVGMKEGRIVWGVECEVCREITHEPGAENLSRDEQEKIRREVAAEHRCRPRRDAT